MKPVDIVCAGGDYNSCQPLWRRGKKADEKRRSIGVSVSGYEFEVVGCRLRLRRRAWLQAQLLFLP